MNEAEAVHAAGRAAVEAPRAGRFHLLAALCSAMLTGAGCFDFSYSPGDGAGGRASASNASGTGSAQGGSAQSGASQSGSAQSGSAGTTATTSTSTGGEGGGCPDASPVSRAPAANALAVPTSATIEVSFGCPLETSTVTDDSVRVSGSLSGPIEGAVAAPTDTSLQFTPAAPFLAGEQITVSITSAATTIDGTPIATTYAFHIATSVGGVSRQLDTHDPLGSVASTALALGDLDGDGDLDAYAANAAADMVWLGDGDGTFVGAAVLAGTGAASGLALADLDDDGDLDAVLVETAGASVLSNNGGAQLTDTGQSLGGAGSSGVAVGDVDADGDLDAVVTSASAASSVWNNDGSGVLSDSGQALGVASDGASAVALGDLDGDGDLDAIVGNASGPAGVWLNDGAGSFSAGPTVGLGGVRGLALGDVDGDGDLDAVAAADASLEVWKGDGGGALVSGGPLPGPAGGVALGDLDGDGDLDAFTDGGRIWRNDGTGSLIDSGQVLATSRIAVGDLDADGDLDAFTGRLDATDGAVLTVPAATSCASLHAASSILRSGTQPLDPGPYVAYCDMDADGGGWTLLFNQGTAFDRSTLGDAASGCHSTTCVSAAYDRLALGSDLRIDASDTPITGDLWDVRTIVDDVDPAFAGASLRARLLDTTTRYFVENDANSNVENQFRNVTLGCGDLAYPDYDNVICTTNVLAVNDPSACTATVFTFGVQFSRTSDFLNCAGWSADPNYGGTNFFPDYLRIWTR